MSAEKQLRSATPGGLWSEAPDMTSTQFWSSLTHCRKQPLGIDGNRKHEQAPGTVWLSERRDSIKRTATRVREMQTKDHADAKQSM